MKTRNSSKSPILNNSSHPLNSMLVQRNIASLKRDAEGAAFGTCTVLHNTPTKYSHVAGLSRSNAAEGAPKNKEFNQMCFYFDSIDQVTLSKYSSFIVKFGGRISALLAEDVTHVVTERHLAGGPEGDAAAKNSRKFNLRPRKAALETPSTAAGSLAPFSTPGAGNAACDGRSTGPVSFGNFMYTPLTSNSTINSSLNLTLYRSNPKTSLCQNAQVSGSLLPSAAGAFPEDELRRSIASGSECSLSRLQDENSSNSAALISLQINQKTVVNGFQGGSCLPGLSEVAECSALSLDVNENILKVAAERNLVIWSKDDLRANLLAELKKYEASKVSRGVSKGLAEYLAEEKKHGGPNRNAITNFSLNNSVSKRNTPISANHGFHTFERLETDAKNAIGNGNCFSYTAATHSHCNSVGAKAASFSKAQFAIGKNQMANLVGQSSSLSSFHVFKHPFILIEDAKQEFRPIHKEYMPISPPQSSGGCVKSDEQSLAYAFPKLNFAAPPSVCPFSVSCAGSLSSKPSSHLPAVSAQTQAMKNELCAPSSKPKSLKAIIEEKCKKRRQNSLRRRKLKGRVGYCECCYEVYTDLDKHSKTPTHRTFATCALNYADIDKLIAALFRPNASSEITVQAPKSPRSPGVSGKEKRRVANFLEKDSSLFLHSEAEVLGGSDDESTLSDPLFVLTKSPCGRKWASGNPGAAAKRNLSDFSAGFTLLAEKAPKCKKDEDSQICFVPLETISETPAKNDHAAQEATPVAPSAGFITRRIVTYIKEKHSSNHQTLSAKSNNLKCKMNLSSRLENERVDATAKKVCENNVNYPENTQNTLEDGAGIVDKISSLLQVISKNAHRSEDDLTIHQLKSPLFNPQQEK